MDSPYTPPNTPLEVKLPQREPGLPLRILGFLSGLIGIAAATFAFHLLSRYSAMARELGVPVSFLGWAIPGALAGATGICALVFALRAKRKTWLLALAITSLLFGVTTILVTPLVVYQGLSNVIRQVDQRR